MQEHGHAAQFFSEADGTPAPLKRKLPVANLHNQQQIGQPGNRLTILKPPVRCSRS
ncbi:MULTISPECIES: hypothetical protein [unclassified Prochlorococcus]|uniref:hypothetical protein n=1 Tax=unclassified Prochlorococcus TaxID=2627481 RepID=UPI000533A080|nr:MULTISPECIES: hypothetical protein [unclassified Prochlorococcus]KGG30218.1 hypothetical protein EV13_0550 [Prochlorococcus sp. MIT 0702]KGG34963.1 hypothetical protein EV14_1007 [Prochlorococcus sp. MIT 0703]